jgi:hypothetical protein
MCCLCDQTIESGVHLFLHCNCAAQVWYKVMRWLSLRVILPPNLSMSFAMLMEYAKDKRKKAGLQLIWNAFMWTIWKVMNDGIYNII